MSERDPGDEQPQTMELPKDEIIKCIQAIGAVTDQFSPYVKTCALHAILNEAVKQGIFRPIPVTNG